MTKDATLAQSFKKHHQCYKFIEESFVTVIAMHFQLHSIRCFHPKPTDYQSTLLEFPTVEFQRNNLPETLLFNKEK